MVGTRELQVVDSRIQLAISSIIGRLTPAVAGLETRVDVLEAQVFDEATSIETRTDDPGTPTSGRIWLRTDL